MRLGFKKRRVQNAPGLFFVDESCSDCDACLWMAPEIFERKGLGAIVHSQPKTDETAAAAFRAMLACPSGSIRTMRGDPRVKAAFNQFPVAIEPQELQGVFHLGFHTAVSDGAAPYLIVRPEGGNIMIDTPR
jgi:ferredoxin